MTEQLIWHLPMPTVLLQVKPTDEGEEDDLSLFGPDSWPIAIDGLPTDFEYVIAAKPPAVNDAPEPLDPRVRMLIAGVVLVRARETLREHNDPRGMLFFERNAADESGPWSGYQTAADALSSRGFWLDKPVSARGCVAAIEASLSAEEREQANRARARYPNQYREDEGWLGELVKLYALVLKQHCV